MGAFAVMAAQGESSRNGLPAYTDGYRNWTRLNKKAIVNRGAHTGTKHVYASKRKRGNRYPYGTVIVKTIVAPGQKWINQVAVMRKVRGANRPANDWVFKEYERPSRTARFTLFAEGKVCSSCHAGVRANDYVFTRR